MTFADLHRGARALLLPNAWDVASAMAFLDAGYEAIGTTSLGVAASHGDVDASRTGKERNRSLARALRVLPCHISIDIEDGYDDDPEVVAAYVADLGVDGINLEDSTQGTLVPPEVHAAKVSAIKRRHEPTFVNARVDTFWLGEDATVQDTLDRARAYADAGADGIFVPGRLDPDQISAIAGQVAVPLNVLPQPGRTLDDLSALGVRRVSSGSLPFRAAIHAAVATLDQVHAGSSPAAQSYADVQRASEAYGRG